MGRPSGQAPSSGDFGLVLLTAIWGINFSVVKTVLIEVEPLALNALRFPVAAIALAALLGRSRGPFLPSRRELPVVLLLGALGNIAYQVCFVFGIDWTLAGNASLLLATTPVWTLILSALAGHEKPNGWLVTGVVATLSGITLVIAGRGEVLSMGSTTLRGDALMILASIIWSAYTVLGRDPVRRLGALRMTTWTLWAGTPALVLMGLPSLVRTDLGSVSPGAWAGVLYAGLLSIAVAYVLWYRGVASIGNNRTAIYSNLVPVWALVVAWFWLGERPMPLQLLGAGIILVGLTVARRGQSPGISPGPSSPPDPLNDPSSPRWRISGNS